MKMIKNLIAGIALSALSTTAMALDCSANLKGYADKIYRASAGCESLIMKGGHGLAALEMDECAEMYAMFYGDDDTLNAAMEILETEGFEFDMAEDFINARADDECLDEMTLFAALEIMKSVFAHEMRLTIDDVMENLFAPTTN